MDITELDVGGAEAAPRARTRKAALEALERLLRAHMLLSKHRDRESPYGILRPATDEEVELIEAVFLHCGVPLPDTLRAIYRRTLGVGNPVSSIPVLTVPFLRAALPDEGFGLVIVGIEVFEKALRVFRDDRALERPPFLHLGHASPAGLTVSRNGLWSIGDYQGRREPPPVSDFHFHFETAFCAFVDQVLVLWANDLAGAPLRSRHLTLAQGAPPAELPPVIQDALSHLVAPRTLSLRDWGDIQPIDNLDLMHATRRTEEASAHPLGSHIAVVGLPYVDYPEIVARIGPGDLLRLQPVDDNSHDPNAVEVWQDGEIPVRVGFVQRVDAPKIRALPPEPAAWRLRVSYRSERVLVAALELAPLGNDGRSGTTGSPEVGLPDRPQDLFSAKRSHG
jgi:hypothetical protein